MIKQKCLFLYWLGYLPTMHFPLPSSIIMLLMVHPLSGDWILDGSSFLIIAPADSVTYIPMTWPLCFLFHLPATNTLPWITCLRWCFPWCSTMGQSSCLLCQNKWGSPSSLCCPCMPIMSPLMLQTETLYWIWCRGRSQRALQICCEFLQIHFIL